MKRSFTVQAASIILLVVISLLSVGSVRAASNVKFSAPIIHASIGESQTHTQLADNGDVYFVRVEAGIKSHAAGSKGPSPDTLYYCTAEVGRESGLGVMWNHIATEYYDNNGVRIDWSGVGQSHDLGQFWSHVVDLYSGSGDLTATYVSASTGKFQSGSDRDLGRLAFVIEAGSGDGCSVGSTIEDW